MPRNRRAENENLQDGAEMSFAAIGKALGMTSQNAFRIYHKAMLKLRAEFERRQIYGSADICANQSIRALGGEDEQAA